MKALIILLIVILLAFAVPMAMMPADSSAYAQASASGDQDQKDTETPPPPHPACVSPAQPGVNPPSMDAWRCPRCGAEHSCKKQKPKNRFYRPMLAPQGPGAGAGCGTGPCSEMHGKMKQGRDNRGMCGMHEKQHHGRKEMRAMRAPDVRGERMRGMRAPDAHGEKMRGMARQGMGNPAMQLSRHAAALNLTDEQVAKLDDLAYATSMKVIDLHAAIEKEQLEVKRLLESDSNDLAAIKQHLSVIATSRVGIQEAKIANMIEAKKLLTDEQKKQIKEALPRMGRMFE